MAIHTRAELMAAYTDLAGIEKLKRDREWIRDKVKRENGAWIEVGESRMFMPASLILEVIRTEMIGIDHNIETVLKTYGITDT